MLRGVAVLWGACLLYLGLAARLPVLGDVDSSQFSWWGHAFGTMLFAALLYLLLLGRGGRSQRQTVLLTLAIAVVGGALIEALQAIGGERDPTVIDVVVDAAGAIVAVLVLSASRVQPRTWAKILSVGTVALLVIAVPAVIFATPGEPTSACGITRMDTDGASSGRSSEPAVPSAPIATYTFDEGSGRTAADSSGVPPLPLELVGRRTSWLPRGGLRFGGGAARSSSPAAQVVRAVRASGELTIWARVRPARLDQTGPARLVTISSGPEEGQVDAHLGQDGNDLSIRISATCDDFNWTRVPNVFTSTRDAVDVAVTFRSRVERVFVDGMPVAAWRLRGTLRNWDPDFPMVVGNEATLDRPFFGDVYEVQLYDQALGPAAISELTTTG